MNTIAGIRDVLLSVALSAACLVSLGSAGIQAEEIVPSLDCPSCEDYNACTVDSCDATTGTCRHDPLDCDDGNPCTNDVCYAYGFPSTVGCRHPGFVSGTACNDGNPCTGADACDGSGLCLGSVLGAGSACDDGNVCTSGDVCDGSGACSGTPLPAGAECDDHNACTRGERCAAASDSTVTCQGGTTPSCDDGLLCTSDSCDPITGDCVNVPLDCNDGNPCTDDVCDPAAGTCARTTREGACDDRNICTTGEFCSNGNCLGGSPANCGWGGQCGLSICLPYEQRCLIADQSPTGCPPPGECGNHYDCVNGFCRFVQGSGPLPCSDGNPCTTEFCVRGGCTVQLLLSGTACDDGSACTLNDLCQTGRCTGTPACSDGDACTSDLCDPAAGTCLGTQPVNCDDGNPCTTDSCDPAGGCAHILNSNPCDDANACTTGDVCASGVCRGTLAVTCADDGNICTDDFCDRATGACIHPNNFFSCNDSNPCTIGDHCTDGSCQPGQPRVCNDFNVCTEDHCDLATGNCVTRPVGGPCSDGNACTVDDTCVDGVCRPGAPPNCDDGNSCTTDGCATFAGCSHTIITGTCDDGNPCTTGHTCVNGTCRATDPVSCIDGNVCTIDFCDRATGSCIHDAASGDCSDGDACTVDRCDPATGDCLGHEPLNCDDSDACTLDACDPALGCTHPIDLETCSQEVVGIVLSFSSPLGRGSGTLSWSTTHEWSLGGFNVLVFNQQGQGVRINYVPIPCEACVTGQGAAYQFILPKHKSGKDVFVELLARDGSVLGTFGPAEKAP